jgi:hypothetical protein
MQRSALSFAFVSSIAALVAAVASGAMGCAMVEACEQTSDCASGLHCSEGACVEGGESNEIARAGSYVDINAIADTNVVTEAPPRIFAGAGGVDIYFLRAPCGELMRARPLMGTVELLTAPPEGTCFADLDVARGPDGIDHAVVRHVIDEGLGGSGAVTIEIDVVGVRGSMMSYPPASAGHMRGLLPRVAINEDGVAQAIWAHQHVIDGVTYFDVERVALPATTQPELVAELMNLPSGLSLAFLDDGTPAEYSLDHNPARSAERLLGGGRYLTDVHGAGTIDARRCGGMLTAAYRTADELRLLDVPEGGSPAPRTLDRDRSGARTNGDLAMTCANDTLWVAHRSDAGLRLYADGGETIEIDDDATTVGLAVVDGTAHIAYVTTTGVLHYAVSVTL